jgi:hypothetical protein
MYDAARRVHSPERAEAEEQRAPPRLRGNLERRVHGRSCNMCRDHEASPACACPGATLEPQNQSTRRRCDERARLAHEHSDYGNGCTHGTRSLCKQAAVRAASPSVFGAEAVQDSGDLHAQSVR